jgi:hypothetical protein
VLRPDDRGTLLAALRAPEHYAFDSAVGTTFSLDLLALIAVPLTFTFFHLEGEDARTPEDPIVLLEALRQHSGRLAIFCQAGQIAIPHAHKLLYSYLEDSVFEVAAKSRHGVFHPKVWALRYAPKDAATELPVRYRLLCLSRNLTFDRSWDTMLVLEGDLTDRAYAFGDNHPVGDFFAALPDLAVRPVSEKAREQVSKVAYEIRRVRFELPQGFNKLAFHSFGLKQGDRWPFHVRKDRALIVSPFVVPAFLKRMAQNCDDITLVSRLDTLSGLSGTDLAPCQELYVLDPAAETAVEAEESSPDEQPTASEFNTSLTSLHAKLYVIEQGWYAQLWTGSANATQAAFHHNVEFMVRLTGKKSRVGIDQFLTQIENQTTFRDLLRPYAPGDKVVLDNALETLEQQAVRIQRQLARLPLTATVVGPGDEEELYQLALSLPESGASFELPANAELWCWPITLNEERCVPGHLDREPVAQFALSLEALTSFFAFEIRTAADKVEARKRFVLKVPLQNAPVGRQERILRHLLGDRSKVLRYLLMLLAGEEDVHELLDVLLATHRAGAGRNGSGRDRISFFEPLVRALARDPDKLIRAHRLVDDLARDPDGADLLPEGFLDIWKPIWQAHLRLVEERRGE